MFSKLKKDMLRGGEIIPKILEILQAQAETTVNLFDIFTSSYGESYRKMRRTIKYGAPNFKTNWASEYNQQQKFYSVLNRLKNQGLIQKKNGARKRTIWKITKNGLERLKLIKKEKIFYKRSINYEKELDDKFRIVIFDIPEKERYKRGWLRVVLISLGFSMLQRSVWMGKNKVSEQLLYDLKKHKMLSYVQIFEISKKGTINQTV